MGLLGLFELLGLLRLLELLVLFWLLELLVLFMFSRVPRVIARFGGVLEELRELGCEEMGRLGDE